MSQTPSFALAVAAVLMLAGCQQPITAGAGAETFGDAVNRNIAAQVVNPDPEHPAGPPDLEGNRAAIAIGRYQTDQVKQPRDFRTTTSVGISTSSGGN